MFEVFILICFGIISGASGGIVTAYVIHKAAKRLERQLDGYMEDKKVEVQP